MPVLPFIFVSWSLTIEEVGRRLYIVSPWHICPYVFVTGAPRILHICPYVIIPLPQWNFTFAPMFWYIRPFEYELIFFLKFLMYSFSQFSFNHVMNIFNPKVTVKMHRMWITTFLEKIEETSCAKICLECEKCSFLKGQSIKHHELYHER